MKYLLIFLLILSLGYSFYLHSKLNEATDEGSFYVVKSLRLESCLNTVAVSLNEIDFRLQNFGSIDNQTLTELTQDIIEDGDCQPEISESIENLK